MITHISFTLKMQNADIGPFFSPQKRKTNDHSERTPKRLRTSNNESATLLDDSSAASDAVEMKSTLHMVHLYEISADPSQQGETSPLDSGVVRISDCSPQAELSPSVEGYEMGSNVPLTLLQTVNDPCDGGENTEVVVMSECLAGEGQDELMKGITAAILTQGHGLAVNESLLGCQGDAVVPLCIGDLSCTTEEFCSFHDGQETQIVAYIEQMPSMFTGEIPTQLTFPPDTVLSSALSSKPITSTVPIVSKHVPPSKTSMVPTGEILDTDGGEGDDGQSEEDGVEWQDQQLEEHW